MHEIIPDILEKDRQAIERKLEIVKSFKTTKSDPMITVHVDIMDGKFVPDTTLLDPQPFKKYSSDLFLELHMMVDDPFEYLDSFAKAGFRRFITQVESFPQEERQVEFIKRAKKLGEVGFSIDSPTSLDAIKVPYKSLDCVLIMFVKTGKSGQKFKPECLEKIKDLRKINNNINIETDGGMSEKTIPLVQKAGANWFAVNSCIFKSTDPKEKFISLKNLISA